MRKIKFIVGEYYHIYNRGVDKREIICDEQDADRFIQSIKEFNILNPIGSIYAAVFRNKKKELRELVPKKEKLVHLTCYCLNPNHFHFILCQVADEGIRKFMHRLGSGYTSYFNQKYKYSSLIDSCKFFIYIPEFPHPFSMRCSTSPMWSRNSGPTSFQSSKLPSISIDISSLAG